MQFSQNIYRSEKGEGQYVVYQLYSRRGRITGQGDLWGQIRDKVEPKHKGEFLVIDIETGAYEMHTEDWVATKRLLAKHPDAVVYGLRIEFPTAYRIGGHFLRQSNLIRPVAPLEQRNQARACSIDLEAKSGKLNRLVHQAIVDFRTGKCKQL